MLFARLQREHPAAFAAAIDGLPGNATRHAADELLATGDTTHVICGSNGRPKLLPQKYRVLLAAMGVPQPDRSEV